MEVCEDCGGVCAETQPCPMCGLSVCDWCRDHVHFGTEERINATDQRDRGGRQEGTEGS